MRKTIQVSNDIKIVIQDIKEKHNFKNESDVLGHLLQCYQLTNNDEMRLYLKFQSLVDDYKKIHEN